MNELVSIITPTYNSAKYIAATIQSVQKQTYKNWEMILVDDSSSDATVTIIQQFQEEDHRIHLLQLQKNAGTGVARNTAISAANGRYIAFLDSDDLWKPEKLAKQISFMQEEKIPFTFSFYDCMDEDGNDLSKRIEAPRELTYRQLFFCNFVGNLTGIYDVAFFGKVPISSIRKRQDWMVWLTLLKKIKKTKPVPESLAVYRIRANSVSSSKFRLLQHNFAVYHQFHQYHKIIASFCMLGFLFTQFFIKPRFTKTIKEI